MYGMVCTSTSFCLWLQALLTMYIFSLKLEEKSQQVSSPSHVVSTSVFIVFISYYRNLYIQQDISVQICRITIPTAGCKVISSTTTIQQLRFALYLCTFSILQRSDIVSSSYGQEIILSMNTARSKNPTKYQPAQQPHTHTLLFH